jgi:hypothetical protein
MRLLGPASLAALAALAATAVPAAADPAVTTDRSCYAPGDYLARTGSGFTPGAQVTESVAFQTQELPAITLGSFAGPTVPANAQGAFKDVAHAPKLRRPSRDYTETVTETFTDPANPSKPAIVRWTLSDWTMAIPAWDRGTARPGQPATIYAYGWTSLGTTLYMHYYLGAKHYKTVRVGRLTGPCRDLAKQVKQFPFAHVKPGVWKVFFSTTKVFDKRGDTAQLYTVRVPR